MSTVFEIIKGMAISLSEFLPLSANGAYQLFSWFKTTFAGQDTGIWFLIFANLGVTSALILIFKEDILRLIKTALLLIQKLIKKEAAQKTEEEKETILYIFGVIPVLIWPLIKYIFSFISSNNLILTIAFVLSGLICIATDRIKRAEISLSKIRNTDCILVGVFRLLGFIPGLSGTGGVLFSGLLSGFSESFAYKYAVIISIPIYIGKILFNIFFALKVPLNVSGAVGCVLVLALSFMAAYHLVGVFEKLFKKKNLKIFSYVLFAAAFISLTLWMRG